MDNITMPPFEDGGLYVNPTIPNWEQWRNYRVGTCVGLYRDAGDAYEVLAIINDTPGNKHVEATFAHFYISCKRDKRDFVIRDVINPGLAAKLTRMGFVCKEEDNYIKRYKEM